MPGRVSRVDRSLPLVVTEAGSRRAEPATHLLKDGGIDARAVVGDWVALAVPEGHDQAIIEAVLPRTSAFVRKDPGEQTDEQVLVANATIVFVVQSLSGKGINMRRLERELVLAWESGARPVVVLSKADIAEDIDYQRGLAEEVAPGVDVIVESAITGVGLDEIRACLGPGVTAALLGGSGVGKSTLVNRLVGGEVQATKSVRKSDDKGRHTTVAREIVLVPGGGVIIDTPGMRAVALWDAEDGIASAFPDIDALAAHCKFTDCAHESEPGCAVIAAVEAGELPQRRLDSYRSLRAELNELSRRQDQKAWAEKEQTKKSIAKAAKSYFKGHPGKKNR
ncbi:MAG: ribosome small subunit-dependent GTPase A [Coriobacteriia bacterium]|nr:ribosome small subunit-dependent GTPase A [Coriobacteriia bacterium]